MQHAHEHFLDFKVTQNPGGFKVTAGSAEVPVTNRRSLARPSSPIASTTCQKRWMTGWSAVYPERYSALDCQSRMSMEGRPARGPQSLGLSLALLANNGSAHS